MEDVHFISMPSEEDLRPTEREKCALQALFDWEKRSKETEWVLGQPIGPYNPGGLKP